MIWCTIWDTLVKQDEHDADVIKEWNRGQITRMRRILLSPITCNSNITWRSYNPDEKTWTTGTSCHEIDTFSWSTKPETFASIRRFTRETIRHESGSESKLSSCSSSAYHQRRFRTFSELDRQTPAERLVLVATLLGNGFNNMLLNNMGIKSNKFDTILRDILLESKINIHSRVSGVEIDLLSPWSGYTQLG